MALMARNLAQLFTLSRKWARLSDGSERLHSPLNSDEKAITKGINI